MKKLLSVLGILILASALLPAQSHAGLRGAFDPITNVSGFVNGSEQGAFRPGSFRVSATAGTTERYFAMTSRSLLVGSETVREMWLHDNTSQAGAALAAYKWPLLLDPAGIVSYADPAWSPDGKWLAYVKTDKNVSFAEIWVQKFKISSTGATAATPDPTGPAMMVVGGGPGILNRHPDWDPTGTKLVYDSNVSGSIDLWAVDVFPAVGVPTHLTFNFGKAEQMPVWSPDGTKVAYATNLFGPFILKILTLSTVPSPTDGELAETNFAPVTHLNPDYSWVPGENALYYDAPSAEDINAPPQIWKLNLDTQAKCEIHIDARGSFDVDVSHVTNTSAATGVQYNYLLFSSTAANFGLVIWRGNSVFNCTPPLPMAASITPTTWNLGSSGPVDVDLTFPAATKAAGFWCQDVNNGTTQGVRMRTSILASPTMLGLAARVAPSLAGNSTSGGACNSHPCGAPFPDYESKVMGGEPTIVVRWDRKTMEARLVALGLVNQQVPIEVDAYSNVTGQRFQAFSFINISTSNLAGSAVRLVQNSPNPFNPVTKITFANSKAGNVELRIFNARGELVNTLAKQWFPQGEHTLTWDGRTTNGATAPSGMYFAQVRSNGAVDNMKMMLMK